MGLIRQAGLPPDSRGGSRPVAHPESRCRQGGRFSLPCRRVGRYHHGPRAVDLNRVGRVGGVRARVDPQPDERRPRTRQGAGKEPWPPLQAHRAPEG